MYPLFVLILTHFAVRRAQSVDSPHILPLGLAQRLSLARGTERTSLIAFAVGSVGRRGVSFQSGWIGNCFEKEHNQSVNGYEAERR